MSSVTDIPDWCHAEADSGSNDYTRGAIVDHELIAMRQASPVAHIERCIKLLPYYAWEQKIEECQ